MQCYDVYSLGCLQHVAFNFLRLFVCHVHNNGSYTKTFYLKGHLRFTYMSYIQDVITQCKEKKPQWNVVSNIAPVLYYVPFQSFLRNSQNLKRSWRKFLLQNMHGLKRQRIRDTDFSFQKIVQYFISFSTVLNNVKCNKQACYTYRDICTHSSSYTAWHYQ